MFPFKKKSLALLGLDISATAVKLLELTRSGDTYRVESYGVEPIPPNSVVDKNIVDNLAVGEAIVKVVKKSGTKIRSTGIRWIVYRSLVTLRTSVSCSGKIGPRSPGQNCLSS